jgi:hypothetical protein
MRLWIWCFTNVGSKETNTSTLIFWRKRPLSATQTKCLTSRRFEPPYSSKIKQKKRRSSPKGMGYGRGRIVWLWQTWIVGQKHFDCEPGTECWCFRAKVIVWIKRNCALWSSEEKKAFANNGDRGEIQDGCTWTNGVGGLKILKRVPHVINERFERI